MEENKIHVDQLAFLITMRCTLKCKLCLVFAPYYKDASDFSLDAVKRSVHSFFEVVDSVGVFNIQGGEPFLHHDLAEITENVLEYRERIRKILITSNGTLLPTEDFLDVLAANRDKVTVNISDYGRDLSRKVNELTDIFQKRNISYHINKYWGEDAHYGGWIDFTDHTLKHLTDEEAAENAKGCGNRNGGNNLAVKLGELYYCFRNARRADLGVIARDDTVMVDLFDENRTIEEKRCILEKILSSPFSPGCKYCVSKRKELPHVRAAVQLTREELERGVEKI